MLLSPPAFFALAGISKCSDDADHDGWTEEDGDCDDTNPDIHPGADEVCNGLDSNCDTETCSSGCLEGQREAYWDTALYPTMAGCYAGTVLEGNENQGMWCESGWHRCTISEFLDRYLGDVASGYRLADGYGCQLGGCGSTLEGHELPYEGMCGPCGSETTIWEVETNPADCSSDVIYKSASSQEVNLNTILQLWDNGECNDDGVGTKGELCCL